MEGTHGQVFSIRSLGVDNPFGKPASGGVGIQRAAGGNQGSGTSKTHQEMQPTPPSQVEARCPRGLLMKSTKVYKNLLNGRWDVARKRKGGPRQGQEWGLHFDPRLDGRKKIFLYMNMENFRCDAREPLYLYNSCHGKKPLGGSNERESIRTQKGKKTVCGAQKGESFGARGRPHQSAPGRRIGRGSLAVKPITPTTKFFPGRKIEQ